MLSNEKSDRNKAKVGRDEAEEGAKTKRGIKFSLVKKLPEEESIIRRIRLINYQRGITWIRAKVNHRK